MKREYMVNACSGRAIDVLHGQTVTIVDIEGGQVVDFSRKFLKEQMNFYPLVLLSIVTGL